MEGLRKFGTVILSIILFFSIISLVMSFAIKDIVQNELVAVAIKEGIKENVPGENKHEVNEIIDKVFEYPETSDIIESFINDYANREVSDKTMDLVIKFITEHKDEYEKITGEKIEVQTLTDEQREELKKNLNQILVESNKDTPSSDEINEVVKSYTLYSSKNGHLKIIGLILFVIALFMVDTWSYYKWLKPVGTTLVTSSIVTFIIYAILYEISNLVADSNSIQLNLNSNILIYAAIIEIVLGISFKYIYKILDKKETEEFSNI